MFICSLGTALALELSCFRLLSKYWFLEEICCDQDLHWLEVSTNKIAVVQSTVCGHSDRKKQYVGEQGEKCFSPCFPRGLVLVLLGSLTAALQGQDNALERKARAGRVGRCHARIGFPRRGILSFLPCCHQGPKHWAMGSISALLVGSVRAPCSCFWESSSPCFSGGHLQCSENYLQESFTVLIFFNGTIFLILPPAKPADLVILGSKRAGLTGKWQPSYKCYKMNYTLQQPLTSLVLPRPKVSARSLCFFPF